MRQIIFKEYNPIKTVYSLISHKRIRTFLDKWGVIRRYFGWQIFSLMCNEELVFKWIDTSKLKMKRSEAMITHNYYVGVYEYEEMSFLARYLRETDRFIDIGANSGVYSVYCTAVLGLKGMAYEPIPSTFQRLKDNIALNDVSNLVTLVNAGLGARRETLSFTALMDATNHVVDNNEIVVETVAVDVLILDDEVKRTGLKPTFIKLDVEGFEKYVLIGANETLKDPDLNVILVELNESGLRYGINDLEIYNLLLSYGFKAYDYNVDEKILKELSTKSLRLNTLFIRDIDLVKARVKSAIKIPKCQLDNYSI